MVFTVVAWLLVAWVVLAIARWMDALHY